jgi:HSP20 family molecular chaperone IbpA
MMSNTNSTKRNNGNNREIVPARSSGRGQQLAQGNPTYLANNLDRIFEDFRSSFNQLMSPFVTSPWYTEPLAMPSLIQDLSETLPAVSQARYPVLDVVDEGDSYTVTAELPGFNRENVDIQAADDLLRLTAQMQSDQKSNDKRYVSHERAYSSFQRVIQFPEHIVANKVEGTMKDGILSLRIPKREPTSTKFTKVALK